MAGEQRTTAAPPLTAKAIEAARAGERNLELFDSAAPGLCIRVTPTGGKVFRWYVRSIGRAITIGRWSKVEKPGHVTLGEARRWLERLKEAHTVGRLDEVVRELEALRPRPGKAPAVPAGVLTVREVAKDFLAYLERERRRPEQARRTFDADILPAIGDRPVGAVAPLECRRIVEAVVARGAPVQAGHVLALLKQFFTFAVDRDDAPSNPAERFRNARALGVEKNVSQRYLSPDEIAAFWRALDSYKGMTPTVRGALKLLLLLGVRSGELLQATWEEVDLEAATWTVPVAHQKLTRQREKTARPWTVPLSPSSVAIFRDLEALANGLRSNYVLASFHATAEGGALTEKSLNHAMRRLFTGPKPTLKFEGERPTPHDLRRTMRTHLGDKLGVPWHIAERCLNHSLGGMTAVYDVADYLEERRAALEKWATYVERLLSRRQLTSLPSAARAS